MRNITQLDSQLDADLKRQILLDSISHHLSNSRHISQETARAILSVWTTAELAEYAWHHRIDDKPRIEPGTIEVRVDGDAVARSVLAAARRHGA